ncbi:hypothetical protein RRF57_007908 [Xylaria bambusicola]|uniref:Nephrocystin 3-like N-terminal domain-containing protein n=1 Tax=Xylaria bambusicola TaxID=326684 RepID=A0AAN7V144_9PEZI
MAPLYGEGMASAFRWLQGEINKIEKCIQDLHVTGPREDKKRIEDTDGGLREDSYCWILENTDFQGWHNIQSSRLLWIKGNSGKGKTMLRCGIINKLESVRSTSLLSYFFCQDDFSGFFKKCISKYRPLSILLVRFFDKGLYFA